MTALPNLPANSPLDEFSNKNKKKMMGGIAVIILVIGAAAGFSNWKKNSDISAAVTATEQLIDEDNLQQAKSELDLALKEFPDNSDLEAVEKRLLEILESRSDFEDGNEALGDSNYSSAISYFSQVIEADKARYALSQEKLKLARSNYVNQIIETAEKLLANKKYVKALNEVRAASRYKSDYPDLKELEDRLVPLAAEEEKRLRAAQEAVYRNALRSMRTSQDKFNGIKFYEDRSTPYYANYSAFYLYIGQRQGGDPYLRFRVRYSDDDWLFVNSASVNIDGDVNDLGFSSSDWERDNGSGDIWEWVDVVPSEFQLSLIERIIESRSAIVRYFGDQYRDDRTISSAQKRGLQNVLNAYEALKRGIKS